MNGNQFYTLLPVDKENYIQVDFPYGDLEFLKFSHFSPGLDHSPFKGIWLSTAKCVLAKMKTFYRYEENEEVIARINFELDLMQGMHVVCKVRKKEGLSKVDLDWFETNWLKNHQNVPYGRVPRYGYLTNPSDLVRILLDENVTENDVFSFENLVAYVAKTKPEQLNEFLDRTWVAVKRPEDRYLYDKVLECYSSILM